MKTKWNCPHCKHEYKTFMPWFSRCPKCGELNQKAGSCSFIISDRINKETQQQTTKQLTIIS